jgi:prophage maintenance system killer protein
MILLAFLGLNSRRLDASPEALEHLVLGIARGRVSKAEAAVFVQQHFRPRPDK